MNRYDFERARKLYPGRKRGFQPEWDDFIKKHGRQIDKICPLLKIAIARQMDYRLFTKDWCPPWKNFKTWLYGSWWTEEIPQTKKPKPNRCIICDNTDVVSSEDGKGWRCWRDACKAEYEKL